MVETSKTEAAAAASFDKICSARHLRLVKRLIAWLLLGPGLLISLAAQQPHWSLRPITSPPVPPGLPPGGEAATGAPPRIGKVEELNKISGVGVLWESGERSWFAYDYWCPLREEDGWSMVLTTAEFTPAADCCTPCTDFVVAPEEELREMFPLVAAACDSLARMGVADRLIICRDPVLRPSNDSPVTSTVAALPR